MRDWLRWRWGRVRRTRAGPAAAADEPADAGAEQERDREEAARDLDQERARLHRRRRGHAVAGLDAEPAARAPRGDVDGVHRVEEVLRADPRRRVLVAGDVE